MQPIVPFWFKQRQCKAEPADDETLRLSGPNLGEAYIRVRRGENGRWQAALSTTATGPDLAQSEPEFDNLPDAWEAAFELYRTHIIV